jgi:hypothetical protein
LVIEAIRLQNLSARSSRARVRATWTMHASSAVRFSGATSHHAGVGGHRLAGEVSDLHSVIPPAAHRWR